MFGSEIRRYFASQTAEVARETLKVEALQVLALRYGYMHFGLYTVVRLLCAYNLAS